MIASKAKESSIGYAVSSVAYMKERLQNGPLSIAVSAGNDCWRFYSSGVLSASNYCPTQIDHGVAIVGLVDNAPQPYWIILNSWGEWWGDHGFIHIAVEDGIGTCAMNSFAEYMDVEEGYPRESVPPNPDEIENCGHDEW